MFLFNPAVDLGLKRHSLDKVHRWRLVLDGKRYIIEIIAGTGNVWADLTTRWAAARTVSVNKVSSANRLIIPGFVQPTKLQPFPGLVWVISFQANKHIQTNLTLFSLRTVSRFL